MGLAALLLLLVLFHRSGSPPRGASATAAADAAARAQAEAAAAAARASHTNHPDDHAAAAQAATKAAVLTNHAAEQAAHAATAPAPWPAVTPKDLPPWPNGWMAANPPPQAVVSRAWQLLPTLWKGGAGTRVVENTQGTWYSYVASPMQGGVKGVVAFKPKPGQIPQRSQPVNNA